MNEELIVRLSWVAKECGGGQLEDDLNAVIAALSQQSQEPVAGDVNEIVKWVLHYYGWQPNDLGQTEQWLYKLAHHINTAPAPQSGLREGMLSGLPLIIAGALYDFAGYLTTRPVSVKYGASELAGPMVDALKEWAAMRGLPLDDAAVQSWQEHIARAADQVNAEAKNCGNCPGGNHPDYDCAAPDCLPQSSQPDMVEVDALISNAANEVVKAVAIVATDASRSSSALRMIDDAIRPIADALRAAQEGKK